MRRALLALAVVAIAEDMNGAQSTRLVHSPDTSTVAVGGFLPPPVHHTRHPSGSVQ